MLTEQQKLIRKNGIGASESATLFNLNEYSTPYQLWLDKTSSDSQEIENDCMWWGSELEPIVRKRYEIETKIEVVIDTETKYSDECKRMICHLDGLIPTQKKLVEIKTAKYNPAKWGRPGTSEIPPQYTIQCQHQLACMTGYESVDLCVFFWQSKSITIYNVKRDEVIISKIKKSINRFWDDHVAPKIPPDLYTIEDVKLCFPIDNQNFIEAAPLELELHKKLLTIKKSLKSLEEEELKYKTDLIVLIGGESGIKYNGDFLCTYKADRNGKRSFKSYGDI